MRKQMRKQRGITLIALIITIIVLLILAGISITMVTGDNGIVQKAVDAKEKSDISTDYELLKMAVQDYGFKQYDSEKFEAYDDLTAYISSKEWCKEAKYDASKKSIIIIMNDCEHEYAILKDGTVESTTGIYLNKNVLNLQLIEGSVVTSELTVSLKDIKGSVKWTNSNNDIATISAETGESILVTAVSKGQTVITASCGDYKVECVVNVQDYIPIGSYVLYNVEYQDVAPGGIEYTSTNGWRYLGKNDDGSLMLISTTTPVYFWWNPTKNAGYENNGWWATDDEVTAKYGSTYSASGYSAYPSRYATIGLERNFEKIPYEKIDSGNSASLANTLIGRFSVTTKDGTLGSYFRDSSISDYIINVRALNLADINKAVNTINGTNKALTTTSPSFKSLTDEALGLFDINAITGKFYEYWVASYFAGGSYNNSLASVQSGGLYYIQEGNSQIVGWAGYNSLGVRVVIEISDELLLEDRNGDGVLEIY